MDFIKDDDWGKLIVSIMVAALLLFHGAGKVLNYEGTLGFMVPMVTNAGLPVFVAYGVFAGELLAPLMILAGVLTRLGGLLVVINMVFALGLAHANELFVLTSHDTPAIELQLFYLLGGLAIVFLGAGRFAILRDNNSEPLKQPNTGDSKPATTYPQ